MEQNKVIAGKFAPGDIVEVYPSPGFDNGGVAQVIDLDTKSDRVPSYFVCTLEDLGALARVHPNDVSAIMNCSKWVKQENLSLINFKKPTFFDTIKTYGPWLLFFGLGFAAKFYMP